MINFANFINFTADTPKVFGIFHVAFLLLTLIGTLISLRLVDYHDDKVLYFLFVFSFIIMAIGEVYKQVILTFVNGEGTYEWYSFPLQFCSSPLYVYFLALILKKGRIYDGLAVFSGGYCTFGGLLVLLVPSSVFGRNIGVNVQSMLHHSLMVITGVVALKTYARTITAKKFISGVLVFVAFMVVAESSNYIIPALFNQEVNMCFIAKGVYTVPALDIIKRTLPYPLFVFLYCLVYTEIAVGLFYISYKVQSKKRKPLSIDI